MRVYYELQIALGISVKKTNYDCDTSFKCDLSRSEMDKALRSSTGLSNFGITLSHNDDGRGYTVFKNGEEVAKLYGRDEWKHLLV